MKFPNRTKRGSGLRRTLVPAVFFFAAFRLSAQDDFQPSHLQPDPLETVSAGSLSLQGNISSATVGAGWRLRGETIWRNPGTSAGSLLPGGHWIEFRPVTGYTRPASREVNVPAASSFTASYVPSSPSSETGWARAVAVAADESFLGSDFFWRLDGETEWRESGVKSPGFPAADRTIEFRPFPGFVTPASREIRILPGLGVSIQAVYHSVPPAAWAFTPLPDSKLGDAPYTYVGKITSSRGTFTGTAVAQYTVLTSLEAVYDVETGGFLPGVVWQAAAHSGYRVPPAMSPAGYVLLRNFADSSLAEPENSLVAIYFRAPVCQGGWSGFHADGTGENWLSGGRESVSAGYPVGAEAGKLHATSARALPAITRYPGDKTFPLNDFPSVEGLRGSPLMLRKSNGKYFPGAIFVGGADDRTFRVIDQTVADVIATAEDAAIRSRGGTFRDGNRLGTIFDPTDPGSGKVRTIISDSATTTWNIASESGLASGKTVEVPAVDTTVSFSSSIPSRDVTVVEGITVEIMVSLGEEYPVWAREIFTPDDHATGETGALEDFDGDGVVNLLEWAFGLNAKLADARPSSETVTGLPVVETFSEDSGRKLKIHYIRRKSAVANNILSYKAQFTGDFSAWDDQTAESCTDLGDGEFECVTVEDPGPAGATRRFARVSVMEIDVP